MNEAEYVKFVLSKLSPEGAKEPVINAALGIAGEAGEIADIVKKAHFHGHRVATEQLLDEVGDLMYYVFLLLTCLNSDLYTVLNMNMDKLNKRYPEGFDSRRSMNRS